MASLRGGNCWNCGAALTALDYGRADTCRKCGRDTKACKGCEFYDPSINNSCYETQAERVLDKERSNFCDYFRASQGQGQGGAAQDAMKAVADALFKKKTD